MRNIKRRVTDLAERIKSAILFPFIIVLLVVMAISGYYDKDDYDWGEYDDYIGKVGKDH